MSENGEDDLDESGELDGMGSEEDELDQSHDGLEDQSVLDSQLIDVKPVILTQ
jgi:hypothetical protein